MAGQRWQNVLGISIIALVSGITAYMIGDWRSEEKLIKIKNLEKVIYSNDSTILSLKNSLIGYNSLKSEYDSLFNRYQNLNKNLENQQLNNSVLYNESDSLIKINKFLEKDNKYLKNKLKNKTKQLEKYQSAKEGITESNDKKLTSKKEIAVIENDFYSNVDKGSNISYQGTVYGGWIPPQEESKNKSYTYKCLIGIKKRN